MKFDIVSDLHFDAWAMGNEELLGDLWKKIKNKDSDGIIVAGDLASNVYDHSTIVKSLAKKYKYVISTVGNHEFYGSINTIDNMIKFINDDLSSSPKKTYFLTGRNYFIIGDTAFIGGCGWYDWECYIDKGITKDIAYKQWKRRSNDSRMIPFIWNHGPDVLAKTQAEILVDYINQLGNNDLVKNIVVVTHTSPQASLMRWSMDDIDFNNLTPSYVNSQMNNVVKADKDHKIKYWIYGHTHDRREVNIGHVTYIVNAYGYPNELTNNFKMKQITI